MTIEHSFTYNKSFDYKSKRAQLEKRLQALPRMSGHKTNHQCPNIDLSVGLRLQGSPSWSNRYLSVTLAGTDIAADIRNPAKLECDDSTHRGWYTEQIKVEMWLADKTFTRQNDGPVTTGQSTQVTSSSGTSIGGNAGMMGEAPMIGIQGGISTSQSYSESIPDFSVDNASTATTISHVYKLASAGGQAYSDAGSLEKQASPFKQPVLVGLPDKAKSNLTINSQAIWSNPDANYSGKTKLYIRLTHTLQSVVLHKSNPFKTDGDWHWPKTGEIFVWDADYDVDFSVLGG